MAVTKPQQSVVIIETCSVCDYMTVQINDKIIIDCEYFDQEENIALVAKSLGALVKRRDVPRCEQCRETCDCGCKHCCDVD